MTVLTGARQTGKTTLVRELLPPDDKGPPVYISLDDPDERLRLATDPVRRLDHGSRLVVLDEIQKQPTLLDAVKVLADRKKAHRFLLLGSSQILLLRQVRETLAGRSTLLELWPLALIERVGGQAIPCSGLDRVWRDGEVALRHMAESPPSADTARLWRGLEEDHLLWGGYPRIEQLAEEDRRVWLRDFRRTYLERDLADLGRVADLDQFALAQNLFAARTGQLLSYSEVSRELGVAVNTVKRYLRFLEISYQVFLLRPLLPTTTARLIKSPKLYWTDPGLARLLSERMSLSDGPLFETAVLNEVLRWSSWQRHPPSLHFYRTRAGREVDFVMYASHGILAMEARAGTRAHREDARPLEELLDKLQPPGIKADAWRLGLVVNRGREVERLSRHVWAVPDWRLFGPTGQPLS
ncbi:MAG: ATP-binding protein [Deltaproteobacteria bacterium]|nr:ATP-binding protein [Deltaproteobacteria bacterium]MBW2072821.1 ATP-binding protein [Deltaproteobacteria bacterium]